MPNTTNTTVNLNANEHQVYLAVSKALEGNGGDFAFAEYVNVEGMSRHQIAGYIGSLSEKDVIITWSGDKENDGMMEKGDNFDNVALVVPAPAPKAKKGKEVIVVKSAGADIRVFSTRKAAFDFIQWISKVSKTSQDVEMQSGKSLPLTYDRMVDTMREQGWVDLYESGDETRWEIQYTVSAYGVDVD